MRKQDLKDLLHFTFPSWMNLFLLGSGSNPTPTGRSVVGSEAHGHEPDRDHQRPDHSHRFVAPHRGSPRLRRQNPRTKESARREESDFADLLGNCDGGQQQPPVAVREADEEEHPLRPRRRHPPRRAQPARLHPAGQASSFLLLLLLLLLVRTSPMVCDLICVMCSAV